MLKRTGAVWQFGGNTTLHHAFDEHEFYRLLRDQVPYENPRQPKEIVPIR